MSQDAQTDATIQLWWENISFPGKSHCSLREDGGLVLKTAGQAGERVLATLTPENAELVIHTLVEKFRELETRVLELAAEWTETDDKLKLASRVAGFSRLLGNTNAIGDFDRLSAQLGNWEKEIEELSGQHYHAKLALVEQAEALAGSDQWKETTQTLRSL